MIVLIYEKIRDEGFTINIRNGIDLIRIPTHK